MNKEEMWFKTKHFCNECKRVLKITKKPSNMEFKTIVKVSALGIAIIGIAGFFIFLINQIVFG